ncbi:MAG TPA: N-acetylglucosamine-specific PTS transporter subunit IIBC [Polyangia bacterium]|nr:N-acetylglucosamine-specific PTS transporter subunit IIBC [Polyangia bacterium]
MAHAHFAKVQKLGRALMLPIAVLPVAGLLLRVGQPDLLDVKLIAQAGEAIFSNLALIFAIGVAVGFAVDNAGVAGLAGAMGYLVMIAVVKTIDAKLDPGVLAGIIAGLTAAMLHNRYRDIRLPEYLAFFGGKRFVPIVTGLACLVLGGALGLVWPPVQKGIDLVGHWLIGAGALGLFLYGVLNRLLLVTGLHHIINSLVWFVFGSYEAGGKVVTGDLHRFFAGDPSAGAFMTGFFPIMMFGLPAACLAMYRTAAPERRKAVGGLLLSMALTSFLTGVTEPVEFTFMFLAPMLYLVHAVLTGVSMALMSALHVRLGFTFSAGAFDYLLSFGLSSKGWLLMPIGAGVFALYYGVFVACIRAFDLATPGREAAVETSDGATATLPLHAAETDRVLALIAALGGSANLLSVDACTTRLRLTVRRNDVIDDAALKALGAKGVVRPAADSVQVVLGPEADLVCDELRAALRDGVDDADATDPRATTASPAPAATATPPPVAPITLARADRAAWLAGLGGESNLRAVDAVATTRLRVELVDATRLDEPALQQLGAQGVMRFSSTLVHVVVGPHAHDVARSLRGHRYHF